MTSSRDVNEVQQRLQRIEALANLIEQRLPDQDPQWRDHSAEKRNWCNEIRQPCERIFVLVGTGDGGSRGTGRG